MSEVDIKNIGLKVGLEIHQQLDTKKKLFCDCIPTEDEEFSKKFSRKLRAAKSELGKIDPAALFENTKSKTIIYYGIDLYCDARISMIDATLGTEINVKTLEHTETLKIESGTQPNSILKIKSQGLPSQHSNRRGDLFVHVVVEIPKKLSKQQKSLLDEFQNSD